MSAVFLKVLNMSISASALILAVIFLRALLRKSPKGIMCLLWVLVGIRLICPVSLESDYSVIPNRVSTGDIISDWTDDYVGNTQTIFDTHDGYEAAVDSGRKPFAVGEPGHSYVVTAEDGISPPPTVANTLVPALAWVWLMGTFAMLVYAAVSYLRLRRRVSAAMPLRDDIWICDELESPFILGIIKPRIYLPSSMEEAQTEYVIPHENAHLKRHDHWWKPLGFGLLALHWFNPMCWLAYSLLCRDIELACDEKAIKDMDKDNKKAYSQALLSCSVTRRATAACPLAFAEVGVKERVRGVMHYKKPAFWIVALASITVIALALCFLTNPTPESYLEFDRASSQGDILADYDVHLGDDIKGATLQIELWQGGKCTDSRAENYSGELDSLTIMQHIPSTDSVWTGCNVTVQTSNLDGSVLSKNFVFTEGQSFSGEAFNAYGRDNDGKPIIITGGEEYILAAMAFDSGSGVAGPGCENLTQDPDYFKEFEYLIVVRAVFLEEEPETVGEIIGLPEGPLAPSSKVLNLNDVIRLSQKGDALGFDDFEQYSYIETGSGLYIRVYEINKLFSLWIGGGSPNDKPIYISLKANATDDSIDIRSDDVTSFISAHKDDDLLDAAISAAILAKSKDNSVDYDYACESHVILATETGGPADGNQAETVTVYAMVLYQEYDLSDAGIKEIAGSHIPTAMTFDVSADGTYSLREYWVPRDGSYYAPDIRGKFPGDAAEDALNTQQYILSQKQICYAKALANGIVDTDAVIKSLFDAIMSSPATSSNPGDYIKAHQVEYRELTYYGDYTLRYVFTEFLKGGQTGLKGHIMRAVMDSLIGGESMGLEAETGQEYFDEWLALAKRTEALNGTEYLKDNAPKAWMLLQMLVE